MYLIVRASRGIRAGIFSLGRKFEKSINSAACGACRFSLCSSLMSQHSSMRPSRKRPPCPESWLTYCALHS